jgi:hydroxypyruvate isomerase
MNLSLCLEMLFTDRPFIDRMAVAARLGYHAIEFWDWRDKDVSGVAEQASRLNLIVAAMSGNRKHALIDEEARDGLLTEMDQVFAVAKQLKCRHIMMLSDVLQSDGSAAPTPVRPAAEKSKSLIESLRALAGKAKAAGVTLLVEPLNTELDHRGCFLNTSALAAELIREVNRPQIKMLYDIYHMSMMREDILTEINKHMDCIGYFHVADKPGRHQPGTGKIDYKAVNSLLKQANYEGFIGMEFSALGSDEQAARTPLEIFA